MRSALLLFDIDGTLVHAHGAGRRSMERAGREVLGPRFSLDGTELAGQLDPHIFGAAARASGFAPTREQHARFRERYLVEIERALAEEGARCDALPGVAALLAALADAPTLARGVVTGNYDGAARAKLRAAGIDPGLFAHCGFGDEAPTRPGLVEVARGRHRAITGSDLGADAVVVIGDTPYDVACARAHGCRSLGVATGPFGESQLREAGADVVLPSFAHTEAALAAVLDLVAGAA